MRCLAVVGAAGMGKSVLLKLMALDTEEGKEDELGVVTPTKGAQRICQDNIDEVLPRKGFKPVVEALTTFVGFGVKVKEPWSVQTVRNGIQRGDRERAKAAQFYRNVRRIVGDEAAQVCACALLGACVLHARCARADGVWGGWVAGWWCRTP